MAAAKTMRGQPRGWESPSEDLVPVTPNDGADLPDGEARGLHIGGAGDVAVYTPRGGTTVRLIKGCAAGQTLPYGVTRVLATSTTATSILAIY